MKRNLESILELLNYQVVINEGNVILINMINGNIMPAKLKTNDYVLYSLGSKLVVVWHDKEATAIDIIHDDKTFNFCYNGEYLDLSCENPSDNGDYISRLSLKNDTIQADLKFSDYDIYVGYTDGKIASDITKTKLEYVGFNGNDYDTIFLDNFGDNMFLMRNSLEDTEIATSKWALDYGRKFILSDDIRNHIGKVFKEFEKEVPGITDLLSKRFVMTGLWYDVYKAFEKSEMKINIRNMGKTLTKDNKNEVYK